MLLPDTREPFPTDPLVNIRYIRMGDARGPQDPEIRLGIAYQPLNTVARMQGAHPDREGRVLVTTDAVGAAESVRSDPLRLTSVPASNVNSPDMYAGFETELVAERVVEVVGPFVAGAEVVADHAEDVLNHVEDFESG